MDSIEYSKDGSSWTATCNSEKWSSDEIELAMDDTISDEELAEVLERTIISVRGRRKLLRSMGLYKSDIDIRTYHNYTDEEDEFIATHSPLESSKFVGVSVGSINYRRRKLAKEGKLELRSRKNFSDDEIELLKDTSLSNAECARRLNRPESSISYKRNALKINQVGDIPRARRGNDYTDEEIELLKDPNISTYECSRRLGRTTAAIRMKRSQLGLDTKVIRSPRRERRGLYYSSDVVERSPYPTYDELKSWGIRIDRDWDDLPFNMENGVA